MEEGGRQSADGLELRILSVDGILDNPADDEGCHDDEEDQHDNDDDEENERIRVVQHGD